MLVIGGGEGRRGEKKREEGRGRGREGRREERGREKGREGRGGRRRG